MPKLTLEELVFLEDALTRHQLGLTQPTSVAAPEQRVIKSTDKSSAAFGQI